MLRRRNPLLQKLSSHPAALGLQRLSSRISRGPMGRLVAPINERLRRMGLLESIGKFVLTIGDEGATLVQLRDRDVVDAVFVAADAEDGWETLHSYLGADPRAKLMVSADVLEQMYREDQMPRVGRFDRGNVLKRRLDVAFPQDRLKAALPLPGNRALFASLPETEAVSAWAEFLESIPNPVVGFCLMPLESADIAEALGPSTVGEPRQVWRVLVSQQASSGYRQIFETEGRMVVTRLTQRSDNEQTPEAIVQLIERELRSSISYVKRLGYSDQDRLDLIILGDPEVCRVVQERDLPVASVTAYTPYQAGLLLGLGQVAPEDSGFADVMHAQWLASKRKPLLTLLTAKLREKLTYDAAFKVGFALAAVLSLFAIADVASLGLDALDTSTTSDLLDQQIVTEHQALDAIRNRLTTLDVPLDDVVFVNKTADDIASHQIDTIALLDRVAGSLDPSMAVQRASFRVPSLLTENGQTPAAAPRGRAAPARQAEVAYELSLVVRLPFNPNNPDEPIQQAKDLHGRLVKQFPDAEIETVHLPVNPLHAQVLEGAAGQLARPTAGPPVVEYLIRKKA